MDTLALALPRITSEPAEVDRANRECECGEREEHENSRPRDEVVAPADHEEQRREPGHERSPRPRQLHEVSETFANVHEETFQRIHPRTANTCTLRIARRWPRSQVAPLAGA